MVVVFADGELIGVVIGSILGLLVLIGIIFAVVIIFWRVPRLKNILERATGKVNTCAHM